MENGQHPAVTQFERSNIYGICKSVLAEIAGGQGVNISAGKGRCANNSRNGRLQRSTGLRLERGLGPLMKRRHQTTVGFNRWIEDEPAWALPSDAVDVIASWSPPPEGRLIERWRELSLCELAGLVASVLTDYLDRRQSARLSLRTAKSNGIAPLVVDSLMQDQLAVSVRAWQPTPEAAAT